MLGYDILSPLLRNTCRILLLTPVLFIITKNIYKSKNFYSGSMCYYFSIKHTSGRLSFLIPSFFILLVSETSLLLSKYRFIYRTSWLDVMAPSLSIIGSVIVVSLLVIHAAANYCNLLCLKTLPCR